VTTNGTHERHTGLVLQTVVAAIALLALGVSLVNAYYQWFHHPRSMIIRLQDLTFAGREQPAVGLCAGMAFINDGCQDILVSGVFLRFTVPGQQGYRLVPWFSLPGNEDLFPLVLRPGEIATKAVVFPTHPDGIAHYLGLDRVDSLAVGVDLIVAVLDESGVGRDIAIGDSELRIVGGRALGISGHSEGLLATLDDMASGPSLVHGLGPERLAPLLPDSTRAP